MRHDDPGCDELRERLDEAASADPAAGLREHAARCPACAELVARQRRLVALLSSMPEAPRAEFGPPVLPARPGGRVLPFPAWIAAVAAAVLVAIGWRLSSPPAERVRVERVVDVAGAPPPVDERLLALTAGVEAVAMRRPTEVR